MSEDEPERRAGDIIETPSEVTNRREGYVKKIDRDELPEEHPSPLNIKILLVNTILSVFGAIIGLELITRIGIATNTSIIGAIVAILIARIPFSFFDDFAQINTQNLVQTAMSGATFAAANALLLPIGVPWLLGRRDLVLPLLIGVSLALIIDATVLYWSFDTEAFPAEGIWPPGLATGEAIFAAAERGKESMYLVYGGIAGFIGQYFGGISMSLIGVAWIGNMWALSMFGIGLFLRGSSTMLFGFDISEEYIPHGIMIGAGLIALFQIIWIIFGRASTESDTELTRDPRHLTLGLSRGIALYVGAAIITAAITGVISGLSPVMFIAWILFVSVAALVSELIVGLSAMHAGWFPAFAVSLIFLVLGLLIGFPPFSLALLVGFVAATGPCFADMGYDLKAGWMLRGSGEDPEFEMDGRKKQYVAEVLAFLVAIGVVFFFHEAYFTQNLFPPIDRVYVATIQAGASAEIAQTLAIWAVPGAIVQLIGGPDRQIGILLATGLLIGGQALGGLLVVLAIVVRLLLLRRYGEDAQNSMYVFAAGLIAGSAVTSFFTSTLGVLRN
jgi:uncharacterized oligopeptide transporter (OPT) family protein